MQKDFRDEDSNGGYYGLGPGKTAMLRYGYPITVDAVVCDDSGTAAELKVICDYEKGMIPKGVFHWVSSEAMAAEIRLYNHLFLEEEPGALNKSKWIGNSNPESEII